MSLEKIWDFCADYPEVNKFLPDDQELHNAPKAWICNVINTVVQDHFKAWVKNRVAERNELWLFGGWGMDASGARGYLSDVWSYTVA